MIKNWNNVLLLIVSIIIVLFIVSFEQIESSEIQYELVDEEIYSLNLEKTNYFLLGRTVRNDKYIFCVKDKIDGIYKKKIIYSDLLETRITHDEIPKYYKKYIIVNNVMRYKFLGWFGLREYITKKYVGGVLILPTKTIIEEVKEEGTDLEFLLLSI